MQHGHEQEHDHSQREVKNDKGRARVEPRTRDDGCVRRHERPTGLSDCGGGDKLNASQIAELIGVGFSVVR